jgi:hypothetical protein
MELTKLPAHSRIWIYQSNRFLTDAEQQVIGKKMDGFLQSWNAHGMDLVAGYEIRHGLFLILAVDENAAMASGCSIDKSVHLIQEIGSELDVDFFNRLLVAFETDAQDIDLVPLAQFEELLGKGEIELNTMVYNNLIGTLGELEENWRVPVRESWHSKLITS